MGDKCALEKKNLYNFDQSSRSSNTDNSSKMQMTSSSNRDGTMSQFNMGSIKHQCTIGNTNVVTRSSAYISEGPETHGDVKKAACPSHPNCPVTILRPKYEEAITKMANLAAELEKAKKGTSISGGAEEQLINVGSDVREAVMLLREDYNMVEATLKKHNGALEALTAKLRGNGANLDAFIKDKCLPTTELKEFKKVYQYKALEREMDVLRQKLASRRLDENTRTLETVAFLQQEKNELQATINGLNQTLVDHRIKVAELKEENKRYKSAREILQNDLEAHIAEVNYLAKRSVPNDPLVVRKIAKLEEQNRELTTNYENLVKSLGRERLRYKCQIERLLCEVPHSDIEGVCKRCPPAEIESGTCSTQNNVIAKRFDKIDKLNELQDTLNMGVFPYREKSGSDHSLSTEMCPKLHNIIQQTENDSSTEKLSTKNNVGDSRSIRVGKKEKRKNSSTVARFYYLVAPVACPIADEQNKKEEHLKCPNGRKDCPENDSSIILKCCNSEDKNGCTGSCKIDNDDDKVDNIGPVDCATGDDNNINVTTSLNQKKEETIPEEDQCQKKSNPFSNIRHNSNDGIGTSRYKIVKPDEATEKHDQSIDCGSIQLETSKKFFPLQKSMKNHNKKKNNSALAHIIDNHEPIMTQYPLSETIEENLTSCAEPWRLQKSIGMIQQYKEILDCEEVPHGIFDCDPRAIINVKRLSKSRTKHALVDCRSTQSKIRRSCHKVPLEVSEKRTHGGRNTILQAKPKDKSPKLRKSSNTISTVASGTIKGSQRFLKSATPEATTTKISSAKNKKVEHCDCNQKSKIPQKYNTLESIQRKSLPKKSCKLIQPSKNVSYISDVNGQTKTTELKQFSELSSDHSTHEVMVPRNRKAASDTFTKSNSTAGIVQTEISVFNRLPKETASAVSALMASSDLSMVASQNKPKLTFKTEILVNIDPRVTLHEDSRLGGINSIHKSLCCQLEDVENVLNSDVPYDVVMPVTEFDRSSEPERSDEITDVGKLLCSILSKRYLADDTWATKDSSIALVQKLSEMMLNSIKNQDSDLSYKLIDALQKGVSSECSQKVAKRTKLLYSSMSRIEKVTPDRTSCSECAGEVETSSTSVKSSLTNEYISEESRKDQILLTANSTENSTIAKCCVDLVEITSLSAFIEEIVEERIQKIINGQLNSRDENGLKNCLRGKSMEEMDTFTSSNSHSAIMAGVTSNSTVDQDIKQVLDSINEYAMVDFAMDGTLMRQSSEIILLEIGDSMIGQPVEKSLNFPTGAVTDLETGNPNIGQFVEEVISLTSDTITRESAEIVADPENNIDQPRQGVTNVIPISMSNHSEESVLCLTTSDVIVRQHEEEIKKLTDNSICQPWDVAKDLKTTDTSIEHSGTDMVGMVNMNAEINHSRTVLVIQESITEHGEGAPVITRIDKDSTTMTEKTKSSSDQLQVIQNEIEFNVIENQVVVDHGETAVFDDECKICSLLEQTLNDNEGPSQSASIIQSFNQNGSTLEKRQFQALSSYIYNEIEPSVTLENAFTYENQPSEVAHASSSIGMQCVESPKPTASTGVGDKYVGKDKNQLPHKDIMKRSTKSVVNAASGEDVPFQGFNADILTKLVPTESLDCGIVDATVKKGAYQSANSKSHIALAAKPSMATKYSTLQYNKTIDVGAGGSTMTIRIDPETRIHPSRKSSTRSKENLSTIDKISEIMDSLENGLPFSQTSVGTKSYIPYVESSASTVYGGDEFYERSISELPKKSNLCRGKKNRAFIPSVRFDPQVKCCSSAAVDAKRCCMKRTEFIQGAQSLTCSGNSVNSTIHKKGPIIKNLEPVECNSTAAKIFGSSASSSNNEPMPDMSQAHKISMKNCSIYGTKYAMTSFSGSDPNSPVILIGGREANPGSTFSSILCPMHSSHTQELEYYDVQSTEHGSNVQYDYSQLATDIYDDCSQWTTLDAWRHLHGELSRIKQKIFEEEGALEAEKQRFQYEVNRIGQNTDYQHVGALQSLQNEVDELLGLLGMKGGLDGVAPLELLQCSTNAQRVCSIIEKHAANKPSSPETIACVDVNIETEKKMVVESFSRVASMFDDIEIPDIRNATESTHKTTEVDEPIEVNIETSEVPDTNVRIIVGTSSPKSHLIDVGKAEQVTKHDYAVTFSHTELQQNIPVTFSHTELQQNIQSYGDEQLLKMKLKKSNDDDLKHLLEWEPSNEKLPVEQDVQLKRLDAVMARARALPQPQFFIHGQFGTDIPDTITHYTVPPRNTADNRKSNYANNSSKMRNVTEKFAETKIKDRMVPLASDRTHCNSMVSSFTKKLIPFNGMMSMPTPDQRKSWWSMEPQLKIVPEERIPLLKNYNPLFKGRASVFPKSTVHVGKNVYAKRSQSVDCYDSPRQLPLGMPRAVIEETTPRSTAVPFTFSSSIENTNIISMDETKYEKSAAMLNIRSTKGSIAFRLQPIEFPKNSVRSSILPTHTPKNDTSRGVFKKMLRVNSREWTRGQNQKVRSTTHRSFRRQLIDSNASSPDDSLMAELRTKYFDSFIP